MSREPIRILLIGNDRSLIDARRLLLERAGFAVIEAGTEQDAMLRLQSTVIRGVVLCSTIDHLERQRITGNLRQMQPSLAIMWVSGRESHPADVVKWAKSQID
jgi:DNA-binding response OmpR family regulator